jgi:hypothetical protein
LFGVIDIATLYKKSTQFVPKLGTFFIAGQLYQSPEIIDILTAL